MAFAILQGDPRELESQAAALASIASALERASSQLRPARDATRETGENAFGAGISKRTAAVEPLLHQAAADMRTAQALLLALQRRLLDLDLRAQAAQHRVDDARRHLHSMPMVPLLQHAVDQCHGDALAERTYVAKQLEQLANDAPAWKAAHPSFLHRFTHDIAGIVGGTVAGFVDLVGGVGGLTVEALWNPHAVAEHWRGLASGVATAATHPGETASAVAGGLVQAFVRPDLLKSDPLAWVVNGAVFAFGGEILKLPRAASRGIEAVAGIAARLEPEAAALRLVKTGGGETQRLLDRAGIPKDRVSVLGGEDAKQIGRAWELKPSPRGFGIEEGVAQAVIAEDPSVWWLEQLKPNQQGTDLHTFETGNMVSIRSIDPAASSYQAASQFKATLNGAIHRLDRVTPQEIGRVPVGPEDLGPRHILIALPDSGLSAAQAKALRDLHDLWSTPGASSRGPGEVIDIHFVVVPR